MVKCRSSQGSCGWSRLGLVLLSLFLSACTLRVSTRLNADGSGEYRTEIGFSPTEAQTLSATSGSMDSICQTGDLTSVPDLQAGSIATLEDRDGQTWCVVRVPFTNLDQLRRLYESNGGITVHQLEIVNGHTYYDITVGREDGSTSSNQGLQALGGVMAQAIDASWQVTFPGRVGANNGNEVQENIVVWRLDPTARSLCLIAES